jgi:flagellar basal-body rod protein FlgB
MLEDIAISALHAALRGLSMRENAISDNVANINTPYYTAKQVAFEDGLTKALENGDDPLSNGATLTLSSEAAGGNGNNVDLNAETALGVKTQVQYELAKRATGDRFTLLRTAIKGA